VLEYELRQAWAAVDKLRAQLTTLAAAGPSEPVPLAGGGWGGHRRAASVDGRRAEAARTAALAAAASAPPLSSEAPAAAPASGSHAPPMDPGERRAHVRGAQAHEARALLFLVNEHLRERGHRLTAVTLANEVCAGGVHVVCESVHRTHPARTARLRRCRSRTWRHGQTWGSTRPRRRP
jgi:hypothetical protein